LFKQAFLFLNEIKYLLYGSSYHNHFDYIVYLMEPNMKKLVLILQTAVLIAFSMFQFANAKGEIHTGFFNSKAASGYDVIAYFTEKKAVEGSHQYTFKYKGADWYFSSAENLALFKEDPTKYAPQYGGYCAWAMSEGKKAPGNPPFWTIYNDKLYLNYDKQVMYKWRANKDAFIQQADLHWASLEKEF